MIEVPGHLFLPSEGSEEIEKDANGYSHVARAQRTYSRRTRHDTKSVISSAGTTAANELATTTNGPDTLLEFYSRGGRTVGRVDRHGQQRHRGGCEVESGCSLRTCLLACYYIR